MCAVDRDCHRQHDGQNTYKKRRGPSCAARAAPLIYQYGKLLMKNQAFAVKSDDCNKTSPFTQITFFKRGSLTVSPMCNLGFAARSDRKKRGDFCLILNKTLAFYSILCYNKSYSGTTGIYICTRPNACSWSIRKTADRYGSSCI